MYTFWGWFKPKLNTSLNIFHTINTRINIIMKSYHYMASTYLHKTILGLEDWYSYNCYFIIKLNWKLRSDFKNHIKSLKFSCIWKYIKHIFYKMVEIQVYSFENVVFSYFAFYTSLLVLKILVTMLLCISYYRLKYEVSIIN